MKFSITGLESNYSEYFSMLFFEMLDTVEKYELLNQNRTEKILSQQSLENVVDFTDKLAQYIGGILDVDTIITGTIKSETSDSYTIIITEYNIVAGSNINYKRSDIKAFELIDDELQSIAHEIGKIDEIKGDEQTVNDVNNKFNHIVNRNSSDLSIGLGVYPLFYPVKIHSGYLHYFNLSHTVPNNPVLMSESISISDFPTLYAGIGTGGMFTLSYNNYIHRKSSVGFSFHIGYIHTHYFEFELDPDFSDVNAHGNMPIANNLISCRFSYRAKYGGQNDTVRFLFEIGVLGNVELPIYYNGDSQIRVFVNYFTQTSFNYQYVYPDFYWGIGPLLFFGFEANTSHFSFELGGITGVTFGEVIYLDISADGVNRGYNINVIPFGIEMRINYYRFTL